MSWGGRIFRIVESPIIILSPSSLAYFSPPPRITSWYFTYISVHTKPFYLVIGQPQWQPCVFKLFALQQPLNNNTLLFKWVHIKYCFQNFDYFLIYHIVLHGHYNLQFENRYILFQVELVVKILVWLWWLLYYQKRNNGIFKRFLIWLLIIIIFAILGTIVVGALILSRWCYIIFTHRCIWITSELGLYRGIKTWLYGERSVWVSVFSQLVVTIQRGWRCWIRICGVLKLLSFLFPSCFYLGQFHRP